MTARPEIYFKGENEGIRAYEGITDAIRISENTVRVTLESGEKAKKEGRIVAATGDWDVWTYFPKGTVDGTKMEKFEQIPRTYELPQGGIVVFDPFGDGGSSVFGSEIRRVRKPDQ